MRRLRFRTTLALSSLTLAATLGADPAPGTKVLPPLVRPDSVNVTIATAPLSVNAPTIRAPFTTSIKAIVASPVAPASPSPAPGRPLTVGPFAPPLASATLAGPRTTTSLSVVAPGGIFGTAMLSANAPGGTFPLLVTPLSAAAPPSGPTTLVTTSLIATAPGGIFTTLSLAVYAPTARLGPPYGIVGPVIGPTGVRLSPGGANGGPVLTVPLLANAPGGTIATASLSASAPGGTFSVDVVPLSALGPPVGSVSVPTQTLTAIAPGGTLTTAPLTANAPQPTNAPR